MKIAQSCLTFCDHLDDSMPGFPVLYPMELAQTHVHWVGDTITTMWTAAHQASCPLPNGACSNSCPLSQWYHPTILSSVVPFSSCLQSFPTSESFLISQLFASGGPSIGTSASASLLPMNIQDWLPLGWTGLISLQSKGLSRVFSSTTIWKY